MDGNYPSKESRVCYYAPPKLLRWWILRVIGGAPWGSVASALATDELTSIAAFGYAYGNCLAITTQSLRLTIFVASETSADD